MASPSSSTEPLSKEEYTPEVAEHRPVDPLSQNTLKDHDDDEDDFDTRTIQDAPPPPTVSPSRPRVVMPAQ